MVSPARASTALDARSSNGGRIAELHRRNSMFPLTLLDHLRLTFGGVIHNYKAHSTLASRLNRRLWQVRIAELVLLSGAVAAALAGTLRADMRYTVAAAILSGAALAVFIFYVAVNLESRIYAHRWCASRLWLIREKYRALLSEIRDDLLSLDTVRQRRDQLLNELHTIVEHAPPLDRAAYQSARNALATTADTPLPDDEIEAFLPDVMRKNISPPTSAPHSGTH